MYFIASDLKRIKPEVVELVVSLFFAVSCLLLYWFLPNEIEGKKDIVELSLRIFLFLFIFPFAYTKIILKKSLVDMYVRKYKWNLKANLFILISLVVGSLSIVFIAKTFLGEYYASLTLTKYISLSFKVFIFYELFTAIYYLFFVIFSFGFVNLITEKFDKLNKVLPIIVYYLFSLSFFENSLEGYLMAFLLTLPIIFFRRIINFNGTIWSLYFLIVVLNIVFNVTIKLLFFS